MIWLTNLRKYHCLDCEHAFRAPDRRQVDREVEERMLTRTSHSGVLS